MAGEPIPGVDVNLGKNPGGGIITTPTGADRTYQFKGLVAGSYDLIVGGQRVQTLTVGNQGSISGVLSREPDGTASITFNGPVGIPDHGTRIIRITNVRANANQLAKANQPIITKDVDNLTTQVGSTSNNLPGLGSATRSNEKAGIAKAEEPPRDVLPSKNGSTGLVKPFEDQAVKHEQRTAPGPGSDGGDVKPGISDQGTVGGLISYSTAPPPKSGGDKLPGLALEGEPIPGIDVKLSKETGGGIITTPTDVNGAFRFDKLPAGKYKLKVPGLPDQSLTVGTDGIAGGTLMRGSDGSMSLFDRRGNSVAKAADDVRVKGKAAENPVGFGSGNMGAGPGIGPMGPNAGGSMSPPVPGSKGGPAGGAAGPMSGAGGPGSPVRH
jgi:hypothetical protein